MGKNQVTYEKAGLMPALHHLLALPGEPLPDKLLAIVQPELDKLAKGEFGGGSANHVAARLALGIGMQVPGVAFMVFDFYGGQRKTGHCRFKDRDETVPPGYSNYHGGAACATKIFAHRRKLLVQPLDAWLAGELALCRLGWVDGAVFLPGKRSPVPGSKSRDEAYKNLMGIPSRISEKFYERRNAGGAPGNWFAWTSRLAVREGAWVPRKIELLRDLPPVAADRYHVTRSAAGEYSAWVDSWVQPNNGDYSHVAVRVDRDGKARWITTREAQPGPLPAWVRLGGVTEHWVGSLGGWKQVGGP